MGLLRLFAVIAVVYLVFRIVARFVLPFLTRYVVKKAGDRMQEQMRSQADGEKIYQDEKVTIRKSAQTAKSNGGQQDDEYIDFEEVKD